MKTIYFILMLMNYNNEVPVKDIEKEIKSFYGIDVHIKSKELPKSCYYKPNKRYRADGILNYLSNHPSDTMIIAITSKDISTTSGSHYDWGIFGLGSLHNNVCVTSTYRLKNKNLKDRLIKVILHEIGHSYGLDHCTNNKSCLMKAGDHTAKFLDNEQKVLCFDCKTKLKNHGK